MTSIRSRFGFRETINWYQTITLERRRRVGISLIVVSMVMFVTANVIGGSEVKTAQEVAFEQYAEALEQAAIAGNSDALVLPKIRLEIETESAQQTRAYEVKNNNPDVILRLLVLMREARLFHLSSRTSSGDPADPLLSLSVSGPDRMFQGSFLRSQFKGNIKAETLFKLITVQAEIAQ